MEPLLILLNDLNRQILLYPIETQCRDKFVRVRIWNHRTRSEIQFLHPIVLIILHRLQPLFFSILVATSPVLIMRLEFLLYGHIAVSPQILVYKCVDPICQTNRLLVESDRSLLHCWVHVVESRGLENSYSFLDVVLLWHEE